MSGPDCDKCGEYFLDCHCEELEAPLERLPSGKYIEVFMYDEEHMRDIIGKFRKKKFSVTKLNPEDMNEITSEREKLGLPRADSLNTSANPEN